MYNYLFVWIQIFLWNVQPEQNPEIDWKLRSWGHDCIANAMQTHNLKLIRVLPAKVVNVCWVLTTYQPLDFLNYFLSKYYIHLNLYDNIIVKKISLFSILAFCIQLKRSVLILFFLVYATCLGIILHVLGTIRYSAVCFMWTSFLL